MIQLRVLIAADSDTLRTVLAQLREKGLPVLDLNIPTDEFEILCKPEEDRSLLFQARASDMLLELGVPSKLQGFRQLAAAVVLCAQGQYRSLTKELYPQVAKQCGCGNWRQVERSIRSAIDTAWNRRNKTIWHEYFPNADAKPSNAAFISRLALEFQRQADP